MLAGLVANLAEGRALVARSFPVERYEPRSPQDWHQAYDRFLRLIS